MINQSLDKTINDEPLSDKQISKVSTGERPISREPISE